jgi:hypothetical protein
VVVRGREVGVAAGDQSTGQIEIVVGELVLRLPVETEVARVVAICLGLTEGEEGVSC